MRSMQLELFAAIEKQYPGWVYFAAGPDGSIKIGYTSRTTTQRLRELGSSLIYKVPGGLIDEKRHLRRWQKYRVGTSEWHRPGDELLLWLTSQVVSEGRNTSILQWLITSRMNRREAA